MKEAAVIGLSDRSRLDGSLMQQWLEVRARLAAGRGGANYIGPLRDCILAWEALGPERDRAVIVCERPIRIPGWSRECGRLDADDIPSLAELMRAQQAARHEARQRGASA